ncbi:MAG: hypothetical protein K0S76_2741 [Herbinix sp.]|jgi:hypothetical protein|nr:hypothetical protein [Herbinix sp.]
MLLKAKKIAFLGLLLACAVLLTIISGILEFNTLFLLAGASFCVGIAIREEGLSLGIGFFIASTILSLFLAPNKLYSLTFSAMGLYLVVTEIASVKPILHLRHRSRTSFLWMVKLIVFNVIYIPMLFLAPGLIYQGELALNSALFIVFLIGGQIALFIYDRAYNYFILSVWRKLRRHFVPR